MARIRKIRRIKKIKPIKRKKKWVPLAKHKIGTSKAEKQFGQFLKNLGIDVESQFNIAYKFYDFHVKGKKVLIEFQGTYYHCDERVFKNGPVNKMQREAIKNDRYKRVLAEANGFKLLEIWEKDFNDHPVATKVKILEFIK